MKSHFLFFIGCILLVFQTQVIAKKIDTLSYAMGYQIGANFKHTDFPVQQDSFIQGLQSGYAGTKPAIDIAKMKDVINTFQEHLMKVNQEKVKIMSNANLIAGEKFLEKNKNAHDVKTLSNGLQYKIIQAGTGDKPTAEDAVTVDYEGKLIDGTIFDSSYKRGKPAQFKVNQVISGWTQALQMMKEGATWMLYIPADLAYGSGGVGLIPPNSVLVFKVHLIKVN